MFKKIGVLVTEGLKIGKGSKVAASVGIAVAGMITMVNNFFNTTAEEFSADNNEVIATDDVQTARRSDTELEKIVGNTEDSDSVIDVEDTEETEEDEVQTEEETISEEDNKEEVETNVENSQNLAVENNQSSETTATDTSTNTTSGTNNSAEAERQAQQRAQREAEERAAQEKAQRDAEERAAQERAQREAEERRAAEEAERKRAESLKIHSRALFLNGQPVGQNARGDIWFYQGQLSGTVEYQNDSGVRRTVSVQSVEVNSNMIGVNDGISYATEASGSISPVVVTQLANGNILLQILK